MKVVKTNRSPIHLNDECIGLVGSNSLLGFLRKVDSREPFPDDLYCCFRFHLVLNISSEVKCLCIGTCYFTYQLILKGYAWSLCSERSERAIPLLLDISGRLKCVGDSLAFLVLRLSFASSSRESPRELTGELMPSLKRGSMRDQTGCIP